MRGLAYKAWTNVPGLWFNKLKIDAMGLSPSKYHESKKAIYNHHTHDDSGTSPITIVGRPKVKGLAWRNANHDYRSCGLMPSVTFRTGCCFGNVKLGRYCTSQLSDAVIYLAR